jgi:hypothetical protein
MEAQSRENPPPSLRGEAEATHGSAAALSRLRHAFDAAENGDYTTSIANRRYTNW